MKRIIVLLLIIAMILPGCGQSGDQVVLTVSEYEALKAQAEKPQETVDIKETETPKESVKKEKPSFTGEWTGQYYLKDDAEDGKPVETDQETTAYLALNDDETWTSLLEGETQTGKWEEATPSVLKLYIAYGDGELSSLYYTFSYINGVYTFSFDYWHHYDVAMTKQ